MCTKVINMRDCSTSCDGTCAFTSFGFNHSGSHLKIAYRIGIVLIKLTVKRNKPALL